MEERVYKALLEVQSSDTEAWLVQNSRICLLRANTADQMLDTVLPAFPKLGVKIDDVVVANFAMWHNM